MSYQRFIALGDSFTEGLNDTVGPSGQHRGWADRVAQQLAIASPEFRYANLAVRGRLVGQVLHEQVPQALRLQPDLVSIGAGINDAMRRHFDLEAAADCLGESVAALRDSGAEVVVFAFGDPSRRSRVMGSISDRLVAYREATLAIAAENDARVVDFWGAAVFDNDEFWSSDRLHLSPAGHQLVACAFLYGIDLADDSWRTPPAAGPRAPWVHRRLDDVRWCADFAGPWLNRRLRGRSSGDGMTAKYPQWMTVAELDPQV